jgi:hypothetical protein
VSTDAGCKWNSIIQNSRYKQAAAVGSKAAGHGHIQQAKEESPGLAA